MFGGFLDEVQLSVTTFRPSNIISMVTLPRTTTLLIHPDYDDDDTNADDEYDADESEAVVFTDVFPERFSFRPVQEHLCNYLVYFWKKCSFR